MKASDLVLFGSRKSYVASTDGTEAAIWMHGAEPLRVPVVSLVAVERVKRDTGEEYREARESAIRQGQRQRAGR